MKIQNTSACVVGVVAGVAIAVVVIARLVSTTVEALKCSGSCFQPKIQNTSAFAVAVFAVDAIVVVVIVVDVVVVVVVVAVLVDVVVYDVVMVGVTISSRLVSSHLDNRRSVKVFWIMLLRGDPEHFSICCCRCCRCCYCGCRCCC